MKRSDTLLPAIAVCTLLTAAILPAQNCSNTSIGSEPLPELGSGFYQGFPGGLWGNGQNTVPETHRTLGLAAAEAVQPLDPEGVPSAAGQIVVLSIGMSNATQEFSSWMPISNSDPDRSDHVVLVDGAQNGQPASVVSDPAAEFWNVVDQRIANAGVSGMQVQAVWLKQIDFGPTAPFPAHAQTLQQELAQIVRILKARFPMLRLCFLSSRVYGGYATTTLNPEPYAYESGFAVQWLLQQQMSGDPDLNADPAAGPVMAPWLGWGPYPWADGLVPRQADGLIWACTDFQLDGMHPSTAGANKVAGLLQEFFTANEFTTPWYLDNTMVRFALYGSACPGSSGVPVIRPNGLPRVGNFTFGIGVANAAASRPAILVLGAAPTHVPFGPCVLLVDPSTLLGAVTLLTNPGGAGNVPIPIPNVPALIGLQIYAQWGVDDPQGLAASAGALVRIGF